MLSQSHQEIRGTSRKRPGPVHRAATFSYQLRNNYNSGKTSLCGSTGSRQGRIALAPSDTEESLIDLRYNNDPHHKCTRVMRCPPLTWFFSSESAWPLPMCFLARLHGFCGGREEKDAVGCWDHAEPGCCKRINTKDLSQSETV